LEPTLDQWRILRKNLGITIERGAWWDLYRRAFYIVRGAFLRPQYSELQAVATGWAE